MDNFETQRLTKNKAQSEMPEEYLNRISKQIKEKKKKTTRLFAANEPNDS